VADSAVRRARKGRHRHGVAQHKTLTALLLWSLYRALEWPTLEVIVVDNGSHDGSAELLAEIQEAGLCTRIANQQNLHHGPGLKAALSWLGTRAGRSPEWVWVLDSDCVVARGDVLGHALSTRTGECPAIIGEPVWDRWHQRELRGLYSLLLDPARVWRPPVRPFTAGGDPAFELLTSAEQAGLEVAPFPFTADGYVIHRGRASLAAVVTNDDRENPLYGWQWSTATRTSAASPEHRLATTRSSRCSRARSGRSVGQHSPRPA
jgi:glycosyltransferase involved in cell wall biosynthesis